MSAPTRVLPAAPDFDQLRRRAKELLADYRAGRPEATAEVARHFAPPLPEPFALSHAQRVLARAYGFADWAALKSAVAAAEVRRLCAAAAAGDRPTLESMIRRRPELVHQDVGANDEHRALHHAVLARRLETVEALLDAGADPHKGIYPHRDATSPLVLARDRGYHEIVAAIDASEQRRRAEQSCPNLTVTPAQDRLAELVRAGDETAAVALLEADPELARACDRHGSSVLHLAAETGRERVAAWVIARRIGLAKPDAHGLPPIDRALSRGDSRYPDRHAAQQRIVAALLAAGAPLTPASAAATGDLAALTRFHAADPASLRLPGCAFNGGLLSIAVRCRQAAVVERLLELGVDPDERVRLADLPEETWSWGHPLWWAAVSGQYAVAERLLAAGADVAGQVYASGDPMFCAYTAGDERMKQLLRDAGAVAEAGTIALYGDAAALREMLAAAPDQETVARLVWGTACGGHPELLAECLTHLDLAPTDPAWYGLLQQPIRFWGDSPWQKHRGTDYSAYPACLRLLLEHGADPNIAGGHGNTPLHDCCPDRPGYSSGPTEPYRARMAALLLAAGARLDRRDDLLRSTPLGWAARWGQAGLVALFLQHGSPATEPDAEAWAQPLAWAETMGHGQVAEALRAAATR